MLLFVVVGCGTIILVPKYIYPLIHESYEGKVTGKSSVSSSNGARSSVPISFSDVQESKVLLSADEKGFISFKTGMDMFPDIKFRQPTKTTSVILETDLWPDGRPTKNIQIELANHSIPNVGIVPSSINMERDFDSTVAGETNARGGKAISKKCSFSTTKIKCLLGFEKGKSFVVYYLDLGKNILCFSFISRKNSFANEKEENEYAELHSQIVESIVFESQIGKQ